MASILISLCCNCEEVLGHIFHCVLCIAGSGAAWGFRLKVEKTSVQSYQSAKTNTEQSFKGEKCLAS